MMKKIFQVFVHITAIVIYPFWYVKIRYVSFFQQKVRSLLVRRDLKNKRCQVGGNLIIGKRVVISIGKQSEVTIGNDVKIGDDVYIKVKKGAKLTIGNNVHINKSSRISANEAIEIGNYTLIAPYCNILDHNHMYDLKNPVSAEYFEDAPIFIGEGVWLGVKVQVNKGVTIGDYSVIGANAVVTKDVAPSLVVGGIPAKKIK